MATATYTDQRKLVMGPTGSSVRACDRSRAWCSLFVFCLLGLWSAVWAGEPAGDQSELCLATYKGRKFDSSDEMWRLRFGVPRPPFSVPKGEQWDVWECAASADGRVLVVPTCSVAKSRVERRFRIYDAVSGRHKKALRREEVVSALFFTSDGTRLAGYWGSRLYLWDAKSFRLLGKYLYWRAEWTHDAIEDVSFSRDGQTACIVQMTGPLFWPGSTRDLVLANLSRRKYRRVAEKQKDLVAAAFDDRDELIVLRTGSCRTGGISLPCPTERKEFSALAVSRKQGLVAVGTKSGAIIVTHMDAARKIKERFAAGATGTLDLHTEDLEGHTKEVSKLWFSPSGHRLVSHSKDRMVRVWDTEAVSARFEAKQRAKRLEHEREEQLRRSAPAKLVLLLAFDDAGSLLPNNALDAGESAVLKGTLRNEGEGIAFDVALQASSEGEHVSSKVSDRLGDIPPGEEKAISVLVHADTEAPDGEASIVVGAQEKRGFNSNQIKVRLPTRRLVPPELVFTSVEVRDTKAGFAQGNGNGIPENGETVELVCVLENKGKGPACGVSIRLGGDATRFTFEKDSDTLSLISSGEALESVLRLAIPRTDLCQPMAFTLSAADARGTANSTKELLYEPTRLIPKLTCRPTVRGTPTNGESFTVDLQISNGGGLAAENVRLSVQPDSREVTCAPASHVIDRVTADGASQLLSLEARIPRDCTNESLILTISLNQDGFSTATETLTVSVKVLLPRLAPIVTAEPQLVQGTPGKVMFRIRNQGELAAENVRVSFADVPRSIRLLGDAGGIELGTVPAGADSNAVLVQVMAENAADPGRAVIPLTVVHEGFPDAQHELPVEILPRAMTELVIEETGKPANGAPVRANQPPTVFIVQPFEDGEHVPFGQRLILAGRVTDDRRITRLRVMLNGVPVNDSEIQVQTKQHPGGVTQKFKASLPLTADENTVTVIAHDAANLVGRESRTVVREAAATTGHSRLTAGLGKRRKLALVVAIDRYEHWEELANPVRDGRAIATALTEHYGFEVRELYDGEATRTGVLTAIRALVTELKEGDNLLIYYAGHGWKDTFIGEGYWIPVEAQTGDDDAQFIANSKLHTYVQGMEKAQHVMVVADSCFSGSFLSEPTRGDRGMGVRPAVPDGFFAKADNRKSRLALTSGADEPVPDGGRDGHSVFAYYFLRALTHPDDTVFTAAELSQRVQKAVAENSPQTPLSGSLKSSGHEDGQMVFVRQSTSSY
ncbi:MAG: hypothetical protein HN976_11290 [Lentisphaerae bacterium]|jgi:uncharacterized caspase-like protein/WD40 repeat protein|nr:hypothetical protein [Lentisphaerota bacterium]MBT7055665.1 hypothetical protein [Lentisphaerota bacterium]